VIGGANQTEVHIDGIVFNPTLELDAEIVLKDGVRVV
jgi:hypothetical protein